MPQRQRRKRRKRREEHSRRPGPSLRISVVTGATVSAGTVLGLSSTAIAASAHFLVDTNSDSAAQTGCDAGTPNDCSLRGAITDANTNGNPADFDYITFASNLSGQMITLGGTELPPLRRSSTSTDPGRTS